MSADATHEAILTALRKLEREFPQEAIARAARELSCDLPQDANAKAVRRYIPVTKWNQFHPWPTIGGLRYLVFHADSGNGFDKVVKRVAGRILLDEQAFFTWVDEQSKRAR
jgi:hypothetical protein